MTRAVAIANNSIYGLSVKSPGLTPEGILYRATTPNG